MVHHELTGFRRSRLAQRTTAALGRLPSKNRPRGSRRRGSGATAATIGNDLTLAVACLMNEHTDASAGMLVVYALYRRSFAQLPERHHGVERAGWGASGHARSQAVAGAMSPASTWSTRSHPSRSAAALGQQGCV